MYEATLISIGILIGIIIGTLGVPYLVTAKTRQTFYHGRTAVRGRRLKEESPYLCLRKLKLDKESA